MKNIQQRIRPRASPCQCAWGSPATILRLTAGRAEVLIACPKCGETRLIEQLDEHRWFCAVCAHSWTIGARNDVTASCGRCLPVLVPAPMPSDPDAFARWLALAKE
jgi:acetyl-CoA carboxylase beta subunit